MRAHDGRNQKGFAVNLRYVISHIGILALLTGCETVRYKTVEVPIRIACVATAPAKPARVTPCPDTITDSQCVKRAAIDIERLDSALDQANELLKACQ